VLSSREERAPVRHDVAADRIEMRARVNGDMARITVRVEPVCTTMVTEYRHVEVRHERTPGGLFTAELATFVVAAGVSGVSAVVLATTESKCTGEPDCIDGGRLGLVTLAETSAAVAAVSGVMVGIDLLRTLPSTTEKSEVLSPQAQEAPCPLPVPAGPHRITLLFADGTGRSVVLAAGEGVVQIPLPDGLRTRFPGGVSARVVVDGRVVGRLHVKGTAP
jgi:hypothetical protein